MPASFHHWQQRQQQQQQQREKKITASFSEWMRKRKRGEK